MPEPTTLEPPVQPTSEPRSPSPALEDFDKTFNDLEPSPTPTPEPTLEPVKTTPPREPETGKFTKAEPKPAPAPTPEPAKAPEKVEPPKPGTPEFEPPQVAKPSELRSWAKRMGTRAEQAEQNLSRLNAKIRELESRPQQQADTKALTDELAATKKQLSELEGEIKVTRYERSGHYKDNYEKPYQETVKKAYRKVTELVIREPLKNSELDENGKPTQFNERTATPADLDAVYYAGNPIASKNKAKELFGEDWRDAINLCDQIREKQEAALEAIQANKGKAEEYEKQQTAQQQLEQEGRSQMFSQAVQAINQKYPALFGERDGDSTWNENLNKGRHMADLAFGDRQGLTPQQSAILDAQIHARVSAFPAMRARMDSLEQQLAAKDKEIAELRGSAPGKTGAAPVDTKGDESKLSLEQAFDKFVQA